MQVESSNPYSALSPDTGKVPNKAKRACIWIKIGCQAFKESCKKHPYLTALLAVSVAVFAVGLAALCTFGAALPTAATIGVLLALPLVEAGAIISGFKIGESIYKTIEGWRKDHYATIPLNHKKVVLIVQSTEDHNGALDIGSIPHALEYAYRPVYRKVSSLKEMHQFAKEVNAQGNRIQMLWINAHGSRNSIDLGKEDVLLADDAVEFAKIANELQPKAPIVFSACETGAPGGLAASLASSVGDRTIHACKEPFSASNMKISCKKQLNISIKRFRWGNPKKKCGRVACTIGEIALMLLPLFKLKRYFQKEIAVQYPGPLAVATAAA